MNVSATRVCNLCFSCHLPIDVYVTGINLCTIQMPFVYVCHTYGWYVYASSVIRLCLSHKWLICVRFKWHLIIFVTTIFNRCKLQLSICYAFYNTIQPLFASWAIRVYRSQTDLSLVRFSCHLIVFVTRTCNLCSFPMSQ